MKQKFSIENDKIETGFSVPNNYFNELEVSIQNKITSPTNTSWTKKYKYILSGTVACIIGISIWLYQPNTTPANQASAEINYTAYINDNIDEFDDELIFESYAESFKEKSNENGIYSTYLLDEDIDEYTLIDEL